ncbi:MAG: D-ribose pyranase [Clostridia bacterium]|nr:D-ribose pyranase [Clostridia bacterium]
MKKTPLLNSDISRIVSDMGHTDMLTVGDCGLPVKDFVEKIDLSVRRGLPAFLDVLDTVLTELCVERIILAEEIRTASPEMEKQILSRFPGLPVDYIPHEDFKKKTEESRAVIRTGECTPYTNVILVSGVSF